MSLTTNTLVTQAAPSTEKLQIKIRKSRRPAVLSDAEQQRVMANQWEAAKLRKPPQILTLEDNAESSTIKGLYRTTIQGQSGSNPRFYFETKQILDFKDTDL